MTTIEAIAFGKNLRPSTVECINKINEIVTAVNALSPDSIETLKSDVTNLKSQMQNANSDITALQSWKSTTNTTIQDHTDDIDKIKITLYTPLTQNDETE